MEKPEVDHVEGLSPTVAVDQKSTGASPRSTVDTMNEVLDFLRLPCARLGELVYPECPVPIASRIEVRRGTTPAPAQPGPSGWARAARPGP